MANYADPLVERSLRERFRLAVESIEEGITVVESGRVVCINDRLSEILGYSRSELARMTDLDLAAPEERNRLRQTVEELRKAQQPLKGLEFWAMRKDGGRLYIRNRYVWEPHGDAVRRLVVFTADLTVQKVSPQLRAEPAIPQQGPTEQMLSEQEAFLWQIIEADPNYVYVKDLEGRFILVNRSYARAFQRQPEDFLGKDSLEMRWPEEAIRGDPGKGIPDILTEERRIMESGRAKLFPRGKVWLGNRWRLMSTLKVPLRDGAGRIWGLASYIREVSEAER
ncbi:MAG TPA: PAS domain S-box protein, partial [Anaerolineae bacterium]|nr:PAS domain S-box protein [Anaerolineae bacterium]